MKNYLVIVFMLLGYWSFSQKTRIEAYRDSLYIVSQESETDSFFKDYTDSLYQALEMESNDSVQVWIMNELSNNYKYSKPDSTVYFARKAIDLARNLKMRKAEMDAMAYYVLTVSSIGNDAKALHLALQMVKLSEEYALPYYHAISTNLLGWSYNSSQQYAKAISYYKAALDYFLKTNNETFASITSAYLGESYSSINKKDSAYRYCILAESYKNRAVWTVPFVAIHIGRVHANFGDNEQALSYLHKARITADPIEAYWVFQATKKIAEIHLESHQIDSALYYGNEALTKAYETGFYSSIIEANLFLAAFYKLYDTEKALVYSETALQYKDSLSHLERSMAIKDFVSIDEAQRQRELDAAKKDFQYRLRMNTLMGSSFTLLIVAFILYRSRRSKQKAKQKIENAFDQLKATQTQLVQSEKMASLGELTAGIAHEIQNPLNFVNNFSEVNSELVEELKEIIKNGNLEEAQAIINDILENEGKIKHHGKRAEGIVKGMLQHSRGSEGKKEPTDINMLADEYMRLAFHGMRARDKSFNAEYKLELDESLPKINVVPQDIGRVLLNLINNAFYAVAEVRNPKVTLITQQLNNSITLSITDNGPGIPEKIRDKIFQPFFTTKPAGQGTGLGLSLSYDIITKGHGGELKVLTKEGEGSEFCIILPMG